MPPNKHDHELTEEERFCLEGCRGYKQYYKMRQRFESEKCAFCEVDRDYNTVLWGDEPEQLVWAWHVNDSLLRPELRMHTLVIPKRHVRFVNQLTDGEVLEIHHAKLWIDEQFGYQGGLWHAREGSMLLNAGTVPHLHYNTFEPDPDAIAQIAEEEEFAEVRAAVYKDPSDRVANQERAARFAKLYEKGMSVKQFDQLVAASLMSRDGVQI